MSHLHQAVLILSIFYLYSGVRKFSCLSSITVLACQRSSRFGRGHSPCVTVVSPPNAVMAVKTHTEVAKKANPRLLYIVLPFGAVSRIIHSGQSVNSASVTLTARETSIFCAQPILIPQAQLSLLGFSLSLKRFSGIITLQKPSKSLLALLLPRVIGHAAVSYSYAFNIFCA